MEYTESEYEIRQDCIVLTTAFDSGILLKYAYYYLLANKDLWNRLYVGTTRLTNLSKIDLGMIEIEYPSLSIQERIIGYGKQITQSLFHNSNRLESFSNSNIISCSSFFKSEIMFCGFSSSTSGLLYSL